MPFNHRKYKIQQKDDRRVKLSDNQKAEIRTLYGTISQRKLARMYGVSRRLIQFIGDPKKYERNQEAREKRGGWKQYYDAETHRQTMKDHRRYKQELYLKGKLDKQNSKNPKH